MSHGAAPLFPKARAKRGLFPKENGEPSCEGPDSEEER